MVEQPTVLVVSRNLPPIHGGMERLNHVLLAGLSEHYNVLVLSPKGAARVGHENVEYIECPFSSVFLFFFSSLFFGLFRVTGNQIKISTVVATSGLVAPIGKILSLRYRVKLVTFVHGLDLVADNLFYRHLFIPFIRKSQAVIANSENTKNLAIQIGVSPLALTVVNPCVEPIVPRNAGVHEEADSLNLSDTPVILSVGRLVERKGLFQFIERSLPKLLLQFPKLKLLIVGEEPKNSVKREIGLGESIESLIRSNGLEENIHWCRTVSDSALDGIYRKASVFVFPLVPVVGDVEGFGIVALEAASYCVPTVAFDEGGVSDAIKEGATGLLVESGDYEKFTEAVASVIRDPDNFKESEFHSFLSQFSASVYHGKVKLIIENEIRN